LRRGRMPRRPRGLAHRVVHAGARRRAWPDGQGGDRAARRARVAAGCPDLILRGREPRSVVVLDRRRSGARDLGDGGAARPLRGAGGRRARREAAAPPTRHAPGPRARAPVSERTVIVAVEAGRDIAPAKGKLGVMLVGLGAVSTTFIAGVENVRRGAGLPIGSLSQMGTIRLGKRTDKRSPKIKEFLQGIKPLPAAFDQYYVKRLQGTNVKRGKSKRELAEQLREDIRGFRKTAGVSRVVIVWCASTEVFITPGPVHQSLAAFEKAMEQNDPAVAPSMLYAYAALMENVPFAN